MPAISDNYTAGGQARAQPPVFLEPDSSGMVLVVVVILAAVAGILAAGLHFASGARILQVRQEIRFDKAFFVAEAGIERAKAELRYRAAKLNGVFTNDGVLFGGITNYGEGEFYVWVRNNSADPDPFVDTDHIVIIRSTGIVETATRVIEVETRVTPLDTPNQADAALGIYGTNTSLTTDGNAKIDGHDWNVPVDFFATGSGANGTLSGNSTNPGVLYALDTTVFDEKAGSIIGDPPKTNAAGAYNETYWYQFVDKIIPFAHTYTGGPMGTREAPIITMLPMGATTINNSDTVSGAGVLIIPGEARLSIKGTFHFEGLVVLIGDGVIDDSADLTELGTCRIFGAMVCVGGGLNFKAKGSADLKYSTQALANLANLQVPAQLDMISWKEIKASSADW